MNSPHPSPSSPLTRRDFVGGVSALGLGLAMGPGLSAKTTIPSQRRRYAIVGTGWRHRIFHRAIVENYQTHAELVGLCDPNPGRLKLSQRTAAKQGKKVPAFSALEFDRMIRETKPDVVIVTTVDATHSQYIIRAMELGCDVITEKPMTTTADQCQRILDTKQRTGREVRVAFNYRYSPARTQVKDLLMSGVIGDVLSVDFHWLLDTRHGADYFRRWHSRKANSGGLLVHKATHHFDLVNWWLGATPETVTATGKRDYYTPQMAQRMGLSGAHERCSTCPETAKCGFYLDLAANANLKELYQDQEHHDGYHRDQCVFRSEIDIEDTMNVIVGYDTGATLSYSLNAFNAWEGYQIAFNGTRGRLEHSDVEQIAGVSGSGAVMGTSLAKGTHTRIVPLRGAPREVEVWQGEGGHGGGDKIMLDDIFLPEPPADKYFRKSDERGGAISIMTGVAANECLRTGLPVKISDLVPKIARPEQAPMPSPTAPVPMPSTA